jgi:hypothetical protein
LTCSRFAAGSCIIVAERRRFGKKHLLAKMMRAKVMQRLVELSIGHG